MKSILKTPHRAAPLALAALAGVAALVVPDAALAQSGDLIEVAGRLGRTADAFKTMILAGIFMLGIGLLGLGCFFVYKDSKQPNQGHAKTGMIAIGVGVLMLCAPLFAGVMGTTFFGGDSGATNSITTSHY